MAVTQDETKAITALTITNIVLGTLAGLLALSVVYFEYFYQPQADPDQFERYAEVARQRLEEHAPEIKQEVAALARQVVPPISSAVYEQAQEDYPNYLHVLKTQGNEYLDNVEQIFLRQVKAQYDDYLHAHRNVLKEEFPQYASDENVERILKEYEHTINKVVERYYLDEFRDETERTVALWKKVEPLELPGPDEPSLGEQLANYTADWTVLALAEEAKPREAAKTSSSTHGDKPGQETSSADPHFAQE